MPPNPLTRLTLSNGLLVLLKEIHTAPLISHWVWYRVGSRDENPGNTGASHWVEHMQFKGTPRYPGGVLDKEIARLGGVWNAFTYLDWTTYFETLPSEMIELALDLEADRMLNSLFDLQDFESERSVIIAERQGNENEPLFRLGEAIQAAAFRTHSYRHEVIGEMVDLERMQRNDLYRHYRAYYTPSNAVLAIAGDFDTPEMIEKVRRYYGDLPAAPVPSRSIQPEPPQLAELRIDLDGPGETTYIELSYHVPAANDPDFLPFVILDSLLTGPSSLNLFGGGISNKTSRLYRVLVESELAVSVYGGLQATIDPFIYTIVAILHPNSSPEQLIAAIDAEISSLQNTLPEHTELARAVKQARATFAYGSESITNQAYWLGLAEMLASPADEIPGGWLEDYLPGLARVTPEDVQRMAQTYLRHSNRIFGIYRPQVDNASNDQPNPLQDVV